MPQNLLLSVANGSRKLRLEIGTNAIGGYSFAVYDGVDQLCGGNVETQLQAIYRGSHRSVPLLDAYWAGVAGTANPYSADQAEHGQWIKGHGAARGRLLRK